MDDSLIVEVPLYPYAKSYNYLLPFTTQGKREIGKDFVSLFLKKHIPYDRIQKGLEKDLRFKTQFLDNVQQKHKTCVGKPYKKSITSKEKKRLKMFELEPNLQR